MHPIIGITIFEGTSERNLPIAAVNTAYIEAIHLGGGLPVLIPNQLQEVEWRKLYSHLDGILFTGGGDIQTELFKGTPHPRVSEVDAARDKLEISLFRQVAKDGKPFLGICRGFQVANVALGGTLYTHIPDQHLNALRHDWYPDIPRGYLAHPVRVEESSRCSLIFGEPLLQVNSLHHQGIKDLAPSLKAAGFAPDGLIEAIEIPDHPFGIAVQWHPEWLTDQLPMRRLFSAFVESTSG